MTPTVGRIVHYRLSSWDVDTIIARRARTPDEYQGNPVYVGAVVPLIITAVFSPQCVNGQVLLDGYDTLWVTSRVEGPDTCQWSWPERV